VEWQDFVQRTLLRALIEGWLALYISDVFDELSPAELERITLSPEQLREMSGPLASFANKNKFARKHGRLLLSFTDSTVALAELGFWMRRVRRIGLRHKRAMQQMQQATPTNGGFVNGNVGNDTTPSGNFVGPIFGDFTPG
jgi:hypothetical protein